ncbi:MAG TPA: efflux RND transporter periplasmic adaptor subunit [Paraburkholderia sp.]|jgi:cobalt-zinc-cadmium efflux system membrane fusion protein|nr:efflux RND transporter periplasmic adaptor subunit [Paraburkholderia sp.]
MNRTVTFAAVIAAVIALATGRIACAQDVVAMPAVRKHVTQTLSAPAHVQAASGIVLAASTAGTVSGLRVLPGDPVRQGQLIARLTGETVLAETTRLTAEQQSAQARAASTLQAAAIEQQKLDEQLSTRDAVLRAQADGETARQQLAVARAARTSYESLLAITAPQSGIVTAVNAADGQVASAGQPLVTIAPLDGLYVVASFYGDNATRAAAGMEGTFRPEGRAPIRVTVRRTSPDATTPGQQDVWLKAADGRALPVGAIGTLSLTVTTEGLAVPASALVLDNGQWWVLVHDRSGEHRRLVVPGPCGDGWATIRQGLAPNERVVTQDAYLLFHRDFAKRYQQAD